MKYNGVNITLNNNKLGGFIPSLDLPPVITCRKGAPCIKGCYARRGSFLYPSKIESMANNLEFYKKDPAGFFNSVRDFLSNRDITFKFFRWFGAGDIVDAAFFAGCVELAKTCPDTKFLMFTKKYEIVNDYINACGGLPCNFSVIFSMWDKSFKIDNPHRLPLAFVRFNDPEKTPAIPECAIPCAGSCANCKGCWSLQKNQSVYFNKH